MKQNVYDYSFEMRRERRRRISFLLILIISVVVFLSLFLNIVIFPVQVRSDTMGPDISRNSAIFVTPLIRSPHRGDVVYLSRQDEEKLPVYKRVINTVVGFCTLQRYYPFSYTHRLTGSPQIRRVLALPGDTIRMEDYVLYVTPAGSKIELPEEDLASRSYNIHIYSVPAEWNGIGAVGHFDKRTLSEDEYFVLSDNRIEGTDSRIWGPISSTRIKGRAILEYFPFKKIRLL